MSGTVVHILGHWFSILTFPVPPLTIPAETVTSQNITNVYVKEIGCVLPRRFKLELWMHLSNDLNVFSETKPNSHQQSQRNFFGPLINLARCEYFSHQFMRKNVYGSDLLSLRTERITT